MNASVSKIRQEAHHWRARIEDGGLEQNDRAAFERWMAADPSHGEAFAEAEILWKTLERVDLDPSLGFSISVKAAASDSRRGLRLFEIFRSRFNVMAGGLAAAAMTMAALILTPIIMRDAPDDVALPVSYQTGVGEVSRITLADGAAVMLGAKSVLEVTITDTRRDALLVAGSAFFDVPHDPSRPFTVAVGAAQVRVTGTAFDVQRRGDTVHVAVEEGSVRVSHPLVLTDGDEAAPGGAWERTGAGMIQAVTLAAGEAVAASRAEGVGDKTDIAVHAIGAWRGGQLVYVRARLADIIEDISRYAEDPIVIEEGARDLRLSGTFDANDIDGLFATLEAALPIDIVERDGVLTVDKKE